MIAFNKDQKLIRNDVDFDQWVEASYLNAGLKSLGLSSFWPTRDVNGDTAKPLN